MATLTGASVFYRNEKILADCFGNNAAILCPVCNSHPVLLIARLHQVGSAVDSPRFCRGCNAAIFITNDITRRGKTLELKVEANTIAEKRSKL